MQRRRLLRVLSCLLAVMIVAGPVSAADFTGSEEEERTLQCPKSGQRVPSNHEEPGPGECQGTDTTYRGKVWTNNVKCGSGGQNAGGLAKVYVTTGGAGVCNDGGTVPIQGRAAAKGSTSGGTVYIDGDKDNSNETAQGWARMDVDGSGPKVRCGDDKGRKDATAPTAADGQDDCG